ncbi:type II toxin-antitoxin system VapC family toxin [Methylobacterium sp. sgz302541]|uniref:type II toxin-antitoxin system VapC family toxin n=1 Tax=unclassified Methylobacterium TaxID=2615210 RepID=UPI003D329A96
MIALDTSAIIAIAAKEAEGEVFDTIIVERGAIVGTPTLLEARMVLGSLIPSFADDFLAGLLARESVRSAAFTHEMYAVAAEAFARFGRGRGHPARLNFGDCLSYAVAKTRSLPLLFKGDDFVHTDVVPAYTASS